MIAGPVVPRYARLGPEMIAAVIERLRELGRRNDGVPQRVADEFRVPLGMVLEIWKARDVAVEFARQAGQARLDAEVTRLRETEGHRAHPKAELERRRRIMDDGARIQRERAARDEPTPEPEVPMDKQREIVAAWRKGLTLDQIADLYHFHPRAVVNCLNDAGYAISVVSASQVPEPDRHVADRARAQGWKSSVAPTTSPPGSIARIRSARWH